jgi:hypothetical protein
MLDPSGIACRAISVPRAASTRSSEGLGQFVMPLSKRPSGDACSR